MSRMLIKGHMGTQWRMNVTQFRSPMSSQILSAATRTLLQQFPVRCGQPDIEMTTVFVSLKDRRDFSNFVRDHQVRAREDPDNNMVTLWWPERDINAWTGYICKFEHVDRRFEWAPTVTFGVSLADSMMSAKTSISSWGAPWTSILGPQATTLLGYVDDLIQLPNFPTNNLLPSLDQQNQSEPVYIPGTEPGAVP